LGQGENYYWVTVGKTLQENYETALSHGVWGVDSKYRARIEPVKEGDFIVFYGREIGFSECQILGPCYEDRKRVWADEVYPYRVKIGPPLRHSRRTSLNDVYRSLLDPEGRPYNNVNAAGRAIGGAAGVFRPLSPRERGQLFTLLGWPVNGDGGE